LVIFIETIVLIYLLKIQKKFKPSAAFFATSTFALGVFLIYKIAFIHYYYFANSLLLLSIVLLLREYMDINGSKKI